MRMSARSISFGLVLLLSIKSISACNQHNHNHHNHVATSATNRRHRHLQTDMKYPDTAPGSSGGPSGGSSGDMQDPDPSTLPRCTTVEPSLTDMQAAEEAAMERGYESSKDESKSDSEEDGPEDIIIPVVWHDVRTSAGTRGLTQGQINASMDVLNDAFSGTGFYFQLNVVVKTQSTLFWNCTFNDQSEWAMKTTLRIGDLCETLNIYSTGTPSGLGWATFPFQCGGAELSNDGVVINYQTAPGGSFAPYNEGDNLVHMVGHWMGLYHTFQLGCNEPDDFVRDTAREAEPAFGCPLGRDTCPDFAQDDVTNYMNFVDDFCMDHFTPGQVTRMQQQYKRWREPDVRVPPHLEPEHPGIFCFSKDATALVQGVGSTPMHLLQIGDEVLTQNGYSPIYAFGHNDTSTTAPFLRIHTTNTDGDNRNNDKPMEITSQHLIYTANSNAPIPAGTLKVGDILTHVLGNTARITKIETILKPGLFAPLTQDGTIVVNNLLTSSYVNLQSIAPSSSHVIFRSGDSSWISHHDYAHFLLTPFRLACLGVSPSLCQFYNEDGMATFVSVGSKLTSWASQESVTIQMLVAFSLIAVLGPLKLLEYAFGPRLAIISVITTMMYSLLYRKKTLQQGNGRKKAA